MSSLRTTLLLASALAVPSMAFAAPANAAACTGTSGVTVVVGDEVGCATGDPTSASAALEAAGHTITPVSSFKGAICQIDGKPAGADCSKMPAADAFWGFFVADAGATTWGFAPKGADDVDPKPGSAIAFSFGKGDAPAVSPVGSAEATSSGSASGSETSTATTETSTSTSTQTTTVTSTAATSSSSTAGADSAKDEDSGIPAWVWLLPLLAVLGLVGWLAQRGRRERDAADREVVERERRDRDYTGRDYTDRGHTVRDDARDVASRRDGDYPGDPSGPRP